MILEETHWCSKCWLTKRTLETGLGWICEDCVKVMIERDFNYIHPGIPSTGYWGSSGTLTASESYGGHAEMVGKPIKPKRKVRQNS